MGSPYISQALIRDHTRRSAHRAKSRRQALAELSEHLAEVSLFATCGKKELRAIAKTAKIANVNKGTQLITEGDPGETMYVILAGSARVSRGGRKIATAGRGDSFGELALLSKGPRTASVVALSDMEVAIITRRQLSALLAAAPAFARKLLQSLADLVRRLDKNVV